MTSEVVGPTQLSNAVRDLVRVLPNSMQIRLSLENTPQPQPAGAVVTCSLNGEVTVRVESPTADLRDLKRVTRVALVQAARKLYPELSLPWGILTGIRPTKIVHRMLDQGLTRQVMAERLRQDYLISAPKADLVIDVALRQRSVLLSPAAARWMVGIYIGIPFCPSRCQYCSFPSYIGNLPRLVPYLAEVSLEITELGKALKERNMQVQSIYIGGGTPTVLDEDQLKQLLTACNEYLATQATVEFTVEAGRPDTISSEKLAVMAAAGVNRVSINPQSMRARTLQAIGRSHTPEEVRETFYLAREAGFNNINMDIILGLPGETQADVAYTLDEIAALEPDSLTVHALAVKRASALREELTSVSLPGIKEAAGMQAITGQKAVAMGMYPYYLYRQKQIFGNLENIGFAKPGKESIYNIQIMEERQSIFAVGAGAASKLVNPADWSLRNLPHPKQPEVYSQRWRADLQQGLELLDKFRLGPIDKGLDNAYNYGKA